MNGRNLVFGLILVLLTFFAWRSLNKPATISNLNQISQVENLPDNWKEVASTTGVEIKVEKTVTNGLKPVITLVKSTKKDDLSPRVYVDRLIAGARSTITGLSYTSDREINTAGDYYRQLAGYYYNRKVKISLLQRVYLKDQDIITLTASYDATNGNETEINSVLDSVHSDFVRP